MMTFKDEYRKDMEKIEPSDAFGERLAERLQAEVDHPTASPRSGTSAGGKRRRTMVGLTVAAACLVLLLCGGTFLRFIVGGAGAAMPMNQATGQSSSMSSACEDRTKYAGGDSSESMLSQYSTAEKDGDSVDDAAMGAEAHEDTTPSSEKAGEPNLALNPETGGSEDGTEENPNTSVNPNTGGSNETAMKGAYVEGYWCETGEDYFVRYFTDPSDVAELDCYVPASLDNAVSKLTLTLEETETFAVALYNADVYYLDAGYSVYIADETVSLDLQSMYSIRVLLQDQTAFRLNLYEEGYVVAPLDAMVFVPDQEAFGLVWSQCVRLLGR